MTRIEEIDNKPEGDNCPNCGEELWFLTDLDYPDGQSYNLYTCLHCAVVFKEQVAVVAKDT
ncbi:MAG: hypothetical protein PHZ19_00230 [Candidatus Thermoplasmatota archaeon]|nr:hypothetical protein [Candidatus Thermoplasmatota archaeon]